MGEIKCFSWNCGGLRRGSATTFSKVMFFENAFKNDFDFFFFLETHHKGENEIPDELLRYKDTHHIVHSERNETDTHSGIIGLIKNNYTINNVENMVQGRILGLTITETNTKIMHRISAVYLPTNKNLDKDYMTDIVRKLRLPEQEDLTNYIILGDFNFIDHAKDKKNGLNHKDKQINKIWVPFLDELDLVDPFREQNPKRKVWSFLSSGGNSRIDRIYVNSINMNNIAKLKYIHTPFHGHRILSFVIKNENEWGRSYFKLNTSLFENSDFDKIVDESVTEINSLNNVNQRENGRYL